MVAPPTRRILASGLIVVGTIATFGESLPAHAWVFHQCKWPGPSVKIKNEGTVTPSMNYGARGWDAYNAWAAAGTDLTSWSMSTSTPSGQYIRLFNTSAGNNGFVGLTSWSCAGGNFAGNPSSYWNQYYNWDQSNNFVKGIAVHELGHAIGLGDTSGCGGKSAVAIMNPIGSACGVFVPQQDDKNGVNFIY